MVSCSIYGATQILLYTASTLYHAIPLPRAKAVLRHFDHAAIYLLIAGTYTPFTLVNLQGPWGWSLFGVVWGLAVIGIATQRYLIRLRPWLTAVPYVLMGWVVVVGIKPLLENVAPGGLALLVSGGLAYTIGAAFYAWKRLPFNHAAPALQSRDLARLCAHRERLPLLRGAVLRDSAGVRHHG